MRFNNQAPPGRGFTTLVSFVIVAAVLYVAKDVFIPLALASLLTFLLAPLVVRLGRLGLGKPGSIMLSVSLAFALIAGLTWVVVEQGIHLAGELPEYKQNVRAKLRALTKPNRTGAISRATGVVKELQKEIQSQEETNAPPGQATEKPIPVEVKEPDPTPFGLLGSMAGSLFKPLGQAGAVIFFVVFMLFQREDLRDRFLRLVSGGELNVATQAVDDAARRVSRYLMMQLVVNATYGLPIGVGLYFIGVPNAFLWGLLATLLRFIPFIGPWIAASFPILLAFAIEPGWTKPILTLVLFVVVELISNNIVEPWLYGASTGISNLALLVAAIFWTWLWGAVGLLLSTPLTVCLLVLGKYVPGLGFLSVLLGNDPVLEPEARFYQRMLAMDEEELLALATKFRAERPLAEVYDSVFIPALSLAERDRHKGALAEVRQTFIVQRTRELIESLGEQEEVAVNHAPGAWRQQRRLLCIPARDEADELAAVMLIQLAEARGIQSELVSVKTEPTEWFARIREGQVSAVCISAVPPFAAAAARHICKRLKQEFPQLKVIVGLWNSDAQPTELAKRFGAAAPDVVVTRVSEAVARIEAFLVAEEQTNGASPSSEASVDGGNLLPVPREPEDIFTSVTREVAKLLDVPVSLVSVVQTDREFWRLHGGVPPDLAGAEALRDTSLCEIAGAADDVFQVEDLSQDNRFASDSRLSDRGIRFYAGVPLRTSDGQAVGTLCVTDTEPHQLSDETRSALRALGDRLMQSVERTRLAAA